MHYLLSGREIPTSNAVQKPARRADKQHVVKLNHIFAFGPSPVGRFRLLAGGLLLAAYLGSGALARAVTFTQTLPMPGFTTGTTMTTQSNPTLGTFNFSSTPYANFATLNSLSITLALYDLQTMSTGSGNDRRDFNNISLTLAGFDTGIKLNEYPRNAGATVTTSGVPTNSAAILQALTTNGGLLTFGIFDATASPSNPFDYFGGTASLTLDVVQAVPFSPSSSAGLGLVALAVLFRNWPRLKRRFASGRS